MLEQGYSVGLTVMWPVEISGQWETLSSTAGSVASSASSAAADIDSAAATWGGLTASYRETETQAIVESAFDEVPEVTRQWALIAGRAADVLQGFATEARGLELQASALEAQARKLQALLWASGLLTGIGDSAEDDALQTAIQTHNNDVMHLNSRWQQLEQQTAAEIDAINTGGGLEDEIPLVNAGGTMFPLTAAGPHTEGAAPGGLAFQTALTRMIRRGTTEDPVDEATELYETVTSDDVTGGDVKAFYNQLGQMDADQIEEFAADNPGINQWSMPQPSNEEQLASWPTGKDGAQWWDALEDNGTQEAMLTILPLLTGNTEGVNYTDRHLANRNALKHLRTADNLQSHQESHLDEIHASLNAGSDRLLLSLNMGQNPSSSGPSIDPPADDPLAAVSVGNPDTADTTTFNVSGMHSGTDGMTREVSHAEELYSRLDERATDDHAVVSWIGYDSPGYGDVSFDGRADEGSWALAYALDGYRHTMEARSHSPETTLNVNAHSYGTNTAAYALTRIAYEDPVDSYSMYGSAGISENAAEKASDLRVATTEEGTPAVYVTDAENDSYSGLGQLLSGRADPTDESFGAYVFSSDGTGHPPGYPVDGHGQSLEGDDYGYLDLDSQAFESLWRIMDGRADEVSKMTDATVEHYESLFDQHVESRLAGDYRGNTYVPDTEYDVTLGGQTQRVETREEAMKLVNDYYVEKTNVGSGARER